MTLKPFLMWPDKRLRTPAKPVDKIDARIHQIWEDMLDSMYAMPGSGVGLGGPQIGVMERLAVVDCSSAQDMPVRMANPQIIHASAKLNVHEEGSPNVPGQFAKVSRPRAVTVGFLNDKGEQEEREFVQLWATSVQHQIDHLNGVMFFDHLSPLKRKMLLAKHAKGQKWRGDR